MTTALPCTTSPALSPAWACNRDRRTASDVRPTGSPIRPTLRCAPHQGRAPATRVPRARSTWSAPAGWLDCPSYGRKIDYFIPSKVPLDDRYNLNLPAESRYSPREAIEQQRLHYNREVGLVIDLTNTDRYYSPSVWAEQGVGYVKIPCKGRGFLPERKSIHTFHRKALEFLAKNENRYILVHCTHGYNRTGYMIVNFLIRQLAMPPEEAIGSFTTARPPGIYRKAYISALSSLKDGRLSLEFARPSLPDWRMLSSEGEGDVRKKLSGL